MKNSTPAQSTTTTWPIVQVDSPQFAQQIKLFTDLRTIDVPVIRQMQPRICLQCWMVIGIEETPNHKGHNQTSDFAQMEEANKSSFLQLCKQYDRLTPDCKQVILMKITPKIAQYVETVKKNFQPPSGQKKTGGTNLVDAKRKGQIQEVDLTNAISPVSNQTRNQKKTQGNDLQVGKKRVNNPNDTFQENEARKRLRNGSPTNGQPNPAMFNPAAAAPNPMMAGQMPMMTPEEQQKMQTQFPNMFNQFMMNAMYNNNMQQSMMPGQQINGTNNKGKKDQNAGQMPYMQNPMMPYMIPGQQGGGMPMGQMGGSANKMQVDKQIEQFQIKVLDQMKRLMNKCDQIQKDIKNLRSVVTTKLSPAHLQKAINQNLGEADKIAENENPEKVIQIDDASADEERLSKNKAAAQSELDKIREENQSQEKPAEEQNIQPGQFGSGGAEKENKDAEMSPEGTNDNTNTNEESKPNEEIKPTDESKPNENEEIKQNDEKDKEVVSETNETQKPQLEIESDIQKKQDEVTKDIQNKEVVDIEEGEQKPEEEKKTEEQKLEQDKEKVIPEQEKTPEKEKTPEEIAADAEKEELERKERIQLMENRQKMLLQLAGNTEDNGFDDDNMDNKMDDTNFEAMEWDQKENPQIDQEKIQRKSIEDKKESEIVEKRASITIDQLQNEGKEDVAITDQENVPIIDQIDGQKEIQTTEEVIQNGEVNVEQQPPSSSEVKPPTEPPVEPPTAEAQIVVPEVNQEMENQDKVENPIEAQQPEQQVQVEQSVQQQPAYQVQAVYQTLIFEEQPNEQHGINSQTKTADPEQNARQDGDNASKKDFNLNSVAEIDKKSNSSFNQPTVADKVIDVLDQPASSVPEIDLENFDQNKVQDAEQANKNSISNKAIHSPETQAISDEKNGSIPANIGSDNSKDPRRGCSENQTKSIQQINNETEKKQTDVNGTRCLSATPQENANKI